MLDNVRVNLADLEIISERVSRIIRERSDELPTTQNRPLLCEDKRLLLKTQDSSRKPHNHERQVDRCRFICSD